MMAEEGPLVPLREAAELMGVSYRQLKSRCTTGKVHHHNLGGKNGRKMSRVQMDGYLSAYLAGPKQALSAVKQEPSAEEAKKIYEKRAARRR